MTNLTCFLAALLLGQVSAAPRNTAPVGGDLVLEKAYIKVRDEAKIPAMEAGVLTLLDVREGDRIKEGEVLAMIDDREAQAQVTVAKYKEAAAVKRAEQTIEIRYAKAAADVAEADWKRDVEANSINKGAVPESEMERKKLDQRRAELQIEKAMNDRVLSAYDAQTARAERKAAQMALDWRTIRAPFDGDVVQTYVHQSEWVQPGEPILRLMRFDRLYVEGLVNADEYDRSEMKGKRVTVEVTKARGAKVTVTGTIVHVDQMLQGKGRYSVRAEVENELVNDSWLLQPGGLVKMTIHLDGIAGRTPTTTSATR